MMGNDGWLKRIEFEEKWNRQPASRDVVVLKRKERCCVESDGCEEMTLPFLVEKRKTKVI